MVTGTSVAVVVVPEIPAVVVPGTSVAVVVVPEISVVVGYHW